MEKRFGEEQVVSVGTYTTLQLKGALKDFDRQLDNDIYNTNVVTSIIQESDKTMLDLYKRAAKESKLRAYIEKNTDIFQAMPTILNQPKSKSIHPCAVVILPSVLKAEEWCPIRTQKGLVVSEWGGYEMESAGFLKEDILGIKQLDKFSGILKLIKKNGKDVPNIYNLPDDREVYRYFGNGWNGDVFQFGTDSLSNYTRSMKPQNIEDLIAANALYRPGPMENHYHEIYIKCKNEGRPPKYLWGTEEITKNTFGLIVYQEQVMEVCQKLGRLTLLESDDVRRAMGKKDVNILSAWKGKVQKGFLEKGCPLDEFETIWGALLEFARYSFNRSHSAAYAQTSYIGQWLKVNFPLEYWTVALSFADELKELKFLSEIFSTKQIKIEAPDINKSEMSMTADDETKTIYWGIESIKGIGEKTAEQIIDVRKKHGEYIDFDDFYIRNKFKGSAVKKQTYESLIASGAFDKIYEYGEFVEKRGELIKHFRETNKVRVNKERDPYTIGNIYELWWWKLKQKELTGLAFIDYEKIANENNIKTPFCKQGEAMTPQKNGIRRSFGGYVIEFKETSSVKGKFARLTIEHNYRLYKVIIWNEAYMQHIDKIKDCEKSFIVFEALIKYEAKWTKGNQFTIEKDTNVILLK